MNSISQNYNYNLIDKSCNIIDNWLSHKPCTIKHKFGYDDAYYQKVKRYLESIKKNNYEIRDKYSINDSGRMSGIKTTVQGLCNSIRAMIFKDTAYDIDIVNCSFNIVKYIIKTYFNENSNKYDLLIDYANNRAKYLKYEWDKLKFIECLFSKNPESFINGSIYDAQFNKLIQQIHNFQREAVDNKHIFNMTFKKDAKNPYGSDMSYIIFKLENTILQEVISEFKQHIIAPIYDGILIKNTCNLESVLIKCNEIGTKYGVEFIEKELKHNINIDLDTPPKYQEDNKTEYAEMKKEFEENHFMIKTPLLYIERNSQGNITYYNKGEFKDITATFYLTNEKGKKISFFDMWLQDSDRLCYNNIVWIPTLDKNHPDIPPNSFNSFSGFASEMVNDYNEDSKSEQIGDYNGHAVVKFISLLRVLTNENNEGSKYLIKYIAHLFQHTAILPNVAIIFKSVQGVGKDLLCALLGAILDPQYLHKDAKFEVFGNFNGDLDKKLVTMFNEVAGKDGHFNKDTLKDHITTDMFNINPKYGKPIKCNNYMRNFLGTNNLNAIDIPKDDRRYVVYKCGDKKNRKFYAPLFGYLNDRNALNSIYTFFMKYDIEGFEPSSDKDRYISEEYKQLQEHNSNPFYEYLYYMVNNIEEFSPKRKGDSLIGIPTKSMDIGYKIWLEDNSLLHIVPNSKNNKLVLLNCNHKNNPVKESKFYNLEKKQIRGYIFDIVKFKKYLEDKHITITEVSTDWDNEGEELNLTD
jgi:hypothetical protein|tara:strand:+ start:825 stop:3068 length:2244 start_codon:yes stop_codon:yes gene_type:complete